MIRKFTYLLFFGVLLTSFCQAQVLVQDATGNSSIRYSGSAMNFDIAQSRFAFSLNSYGNEYIKGKNRIINFLGVQASADSKNGLAKLIDSGDIVPKGMFNLTLGHSWISASKSEKDINDLESIARQNGITDGQFETDLRGFIKSFFTDRSLPDGVRDALLSKLIPEGMHKYSEKIAAFRSEKVVVDAKDEALIRQLSELALEVNTRVDVYLLSREGNKKDIDRLVSRISRSYWNSRHLVYGLVGWEATKFTFLNDSTSVNFDTRFKDITFQSFKLGVGYNYQRAGKGMFGFSLTTQALNNFLLLEDAEFVRTTTVQTTNTTETASPKSSTVVNDKLEGKKTFTAYGGKYGSYRQLGINVDYVDFYSAFDSERSVLAVNYYLRQNFSSNSIAYPETSTIGVGGYFFKNSGTFIGGLYVECQDIFDNIQRMKAKPELSPFYNRINFGIVAKFSFNSVIDYRPL
jgi:hypothetical protein